MKEIGGYFELEVSAKEPYHLNAIQLNSARNCLRYLIRDLKITEMWVPRYTCPVVWDALAKEHCNPRFYSISEDLLPKEQMEQDSYVLYTNYFGICGRQVQKLAEIYRNLIIDYAQSFFSLPAGMAAFYSPRKFFGVPDGGYLTGKNVTGNVKVPCGSSYRRFEHLLKRVELSAQEGYENFKYNEAVLDHEPPRQMSPLTEKLLAGIDYKYCAQKRRENYQYLDALLGDMNEFQGKSLETESVPMIYPFLIKSIGLREKLLKRKIFTAVYWTGQTDGGYGSLLEKFLIPLPVDQRYSPDDMQYLAEQIKNLM